MRIKTQVNVQKGDYLSVVKNEGILLFVDKEGEIVGETNEYFEIMAGRKLKAVVKDIFEGEVEVKILRFADLHRHSGYSLLDGATKISDMVELTEYAGALTDHGNMFGFLKYYEAMKNAGKQPILGFEAYSETMEGEKKRNHLLLLAKNQKGYKNLVKLTSMAYENFYSKPHVSYEMLKKHSEGVIATSACLGGEIQQAILAGDMKKAIKVAKWFKNVFGDDFYLEVQRHDMGREELVVNNGLIQIAGELSIKIVATTDSHYTKVEDKEMHEILLCMQTGKTLSDEKRMRFPGRDYHIHTAQEMEKKFSDMPEALDTTLEIAEKCAGFELELGKLYLPKFEVPEGHTETSYLKKLTWEGFNKRFAGTPQLTDPVYIERLTFELNVIEQMGYDSYFLIVADFIGYAKSNGILVGPGRGSAVGSLASYALSIVDLDPIPYGLLFERFLNPERVSMPDIDVDFDFERRDEVIDYVRQKYGDKAVSKIVTFGTMAARSVVRDIARVMDFPYQVGDKIAKSIPAEIGITISKALVQNPELKELYENDSDIKKIINTALKLEGLPRHNSIHACGVVIAASDVDNYIPELIMGAGKSGIHERTAQVTKDEVETLGLLKMDFLGLRTMTQISYAIKSINKNEKIGLAYDDISITDPYVFREIAKGKTYGVFQLESGGMRSFMTQLYEDVNVRINALESKFKTQGLPNADIDFTKAMQTFGQELFERLIAGVSLYRPGPMDYIPNYLNGIRKPENIVYMTPKLEPILSSTYGTIVYQEQVMAIVQKLAGYTLGRADLVRRAMGKKKIEVMNQEKNYFIHGKLNEDGTVDVPGCVRNGISEDVATEIWNQMEDFSKYAFNKSHAAAYAVIASVTGWLKTYYPIDFMASVLNTFTGNSEKLTNYLAVSKDMDISIVPPHVNKSDELFSRFKKDIAFALKGIRNVGVTSALIVTERAERGDFDDYEDFVMRMVKNHKITKRAIKGLVYSGALDEFEGTRRAQLHIADTLLQKAAEDKAISESGQITWFDLDENLAAKNKVAIPEMEEFDKKHKLAKEKEYAGFYVTEHPLDDYVKYYKDKDVTEIGFITMKDDEEGEVEDVNRESYHGKHVTLAGLVEDIKTFYTKKDNKPIYVFTLEGRSGKIECVVFADKLETNRSKIQEGKIVTVEGTIKEDEFKSQCIVTGMMDIEAIAQAKKEPKLIAIRLSDEKAYSVLKKEILNISHFKGEIPVFVVINGKKFKSKQSLNYSLGTVTKLNNLYGENCKVVY